MVSLGVSDGPAPVRARPGAAPRRRLVDHRPAAPAVEALLARSRLVGGDGGEALVVSLDRQPSRPRQLVDLGQGGRRRPGRREPSSDSGRPTTHEPGLLLGDQLGDAPVVAAAVAAALDHLVRGGERAGGVGHGDADAPGAEVDAEAPSRPAGGRPRPGPWSSAASRPSASLPPATARIGCLAAAALDQLLGRLGDELAGVEARCPGVTAATSAAPPPSGAAAEHHGPDAGLVAQRRRRGRAGRRARAPSTRLDDDAVDRLRPASASACAAGRLALERLDLVAQRLDLVEPLAGAVDHLADGHVEHLGQLGRAASSSSRSRSIGPVPVTASMRRRLAPIDASDTIFTGPMSPSARTWVPPHSSIEWRPASSTRTMSPYLSPKNAMAPSAAASALVVS